MPIVSTGGTLSGGLRGARLVAADADEYNSHLLRSLIVSSLAQSNGGGGYSGNTPLIPLNVTMPEPKSAPPPEIVRMPQRDLPVNMSSLFPNTKYETSNDRAPGTQPPPISQQIVYKYDPYRDYPEAEHVWADAPPRPLTPLVMPYQVLKEKDRKPARVFRTPDALAQDFHEKWFAKAAKDKNELGAVIYYYLDPTDKHARFYYGPVIRGGRGGFNTFPAYKNQGGVGSIHTHPEEMGTSLGNRSTVGKHWLPSDPDVNSYKDDRFMIIDSPNAIHLYQDHGADRYVPLPVLSPAAREPQAVPALSFDVPAQAPRTWSPVSPIQPVVPLSSGF